MTMQRPKMTSRWGKALTSPEAPLASLRVMRENLITPRTTNQIWEWGYLEGRIDERENMLQRYAAGARFGDDLKPEQYLTPYIPKLTFGERVIWLFTGALPKRLERGVRKD